MAASRKDTEQSRDHLSPEQRSWNMSRIRDRNSKPEIDLRSALHRRGLRFRVHYSKLPGKPDIVFPRYRIVVFVNGCFWHRHEGCHLTTTPTKNREFWIKKFRSNVDRDKRQQSELEQMGWSVLVVWECEIESDLAGAVTRVSRALCADEGDHDMAAEARRRYGRDQS